MKSKKTLLLFCSILILISVIGTLGIYDMLPTEVPIHFNFAGEVNAYGPRSSVFITGLLPVGFILLWLVLPKLDPRGQSYTKHQTAYSNLLLALTLFFIILHWTTIGLALGYAFSITHIIFTLVGILFIIIGNYMPQIRSNYTFGIRLPWTLNDTDNWRYTHRIGGYTFMLSGLLFIISNFVNNEIQVVLFITGVAMAALVPMIASYLYYRKHSCH